MVGKYLICRSLQSPLVAGNDWQGEGRLGVASNQLLAVSVAQFLSPKTIQFKNFPDRISSYTGLQHDIGVPLC